MFINSRTSYQTDTQKKTQKTHSASSSASWWGPWACPCEWETSSCCPPPPLASLHPSAAASSPQPSLQHKIKNILPVVFVARNGAMCARKEQCARVLLISDCQPIYWLLRLVFAEAARKKKRLAKFSLLLSDLFASRAQSSGDVGNQRLEKKSCAFSVCTLLLSSRSRVL